MDTGLVASVATFRVYNSSSRSSGVATYNGRNGPAGLGTPPTRKDRMAATPVTEGPLLLSRLASNEITYLQVSNFTRAIMPRSRIWRVSETELVIPASFTNYWLITLSGPSEAIARLDRLVNSLCRYEVIGEELPVGNDDLLPSAFDINSGSDSTEFSESVAEMRNSIASSKASQRAGRAELVPSVPHEPSKSSDGEAVCGQEEGLGSMSNYNYADESEDGKDQNLERETSLSLKQRRNGDKPGWGPSSRYENVNPRDSVTFPPESSDVDTLGIQTKSATSTEKEGCEPRDQYLSTVITSPPISPSSLSSLSLPENPDARSPPQKSSEKVAIHLATPPREKESLVKDESSEESPKRQTPRARVVTTSPEPDIQDSRADQKQQFMTPLPSDRFGPRFSHPLIPSAHISRFYHVQPPPHSPSRTARLSLQGRDLTTIGPNSFHQEVTTVGGYIGLRAVNHLLRKS